MRLNLHSDLEVYQLAFEAAMRIFQLSKSFPGAERFSLTDQIRRSSRSVCANIAEAFRKRRYVRSFVLKLSDSEGEAAETQVWLAFANRCLYLDANSAQELTAIYNNILGKLVTMINQAEKWTF